MNDLVLVGLARDAAEAVSEKFHVALAAAISARHQVSVLSPVRH